ncbi:MAG TPA: hypothetical protein VFV05_14995 [Methylomirabilota bacterium]|nr:hypothetical protein [Methylomirabilota bacterium]
METQLDLFLDGRDAFLVHDVTTGLVARDRRRAETGLERLRDEHPLHPDLPALALLVEALGSPPTAPASHTTMTAGTEELRHRLAPAARRLLGEGAAAFLEPLWQALARQAADLAFDEAYPLAHRSWLCRQYGDWAAVRAAVEAAPDWPASPRLRYRLGLARYHLGEADAAIRLWLPLCWTDPGFFARRAPTLPSTTLREGWEAFERAAPYEESLAETGDATGWFPAWLLLRHRGLARLFRADEIPDTGVASRVFRHLLALLPLESQGLSDALIAGRRALRQLSPSFFGSYMDVVARTGARPPRPSSS